MTRPRTLCVASSFHLRARLSAFCGGEPVAIGSSKVRYRHWRQSDYFWFDSSSHWVRHGDCDCVDNRNDCALGWTGSLASGSDGPRYWRSTALLLSFNAGKRLAHLLLSLVHKCHGQLRAHRRGAKHWLITSNLTPKFCGLRYFEKRDVARLLTLMPSPPTLSTKWAFGGKRVAGSTVATPYSCATVHSQDELVRVLS